MVLVLGRIFLFPTTSQNRFLLPFSLHERIVPNLLFSIFFTALFIMIQHVSPELILVAVLSQP